MKSTPTAATPAEPRGNVIEIVSRRAPKPTDRSHQDRLLLSDFVRRVILRATWSDRSASAEDRLGSAWVDVLIDSMGSGGLAYSIECALRRVGFRENSYRYKVRVLLYLSRQLDRERNWRTA